jgi:RHS repeat-associated protein
MRLRAAQRAALAAAAIDDARRERVLGLRASGFTVSEDGPALAVQDAAGGSARVDSNGLRARVTTAEGRIIGVEQFANGRIRRIVDAAGREATFDRDEAGSLRSIDRGPGGGVFRFALSRDWQPLSIEYPDGARASAEYSPAGQPLRVVNRDGTELRYAYAPDGRLTALTDPLGRTTRLSDAGSPGSRTIHYPNGDRHEYVEDPAVRRLRHSVNGAVHSDYRYEPETGGLTVEYADGGRDRFRFADGRIVEASNAHATVTLAYDERGRLLAETTDGRVVRYLRNAVGALVGIVSPDGETIAYRRDRDQRLTGITDWDGGRYEIVLPAAGPPTELRYPNGVIVSGASGAMGLPASWTVTRADTRETLDTASWEHDTCDRLTASTREGRRREYRYDGGGRLVEVRGADAASSERFDLDAVGNRVRSGDEPCHYDPMNRLLRQGTREFAYDGLGNQTADRGGAGGRYRYDGRGRLVEARARGRVIAYEYDALGRRIRKRVDGVTTRYEWAGTQLLAEVVERGGAAVRRDYLVCPEFLSPLAFREESRTYAVHCGRLQEPLCVTDPAGRVVWKADYLAFGRARVGVERVRQPWRLPGQYHDDETGLHYSLARYYDPDLGRYLAVDPRRTPGASLNYYTYCDGDPLNRIDPTGEISLTLGTVLLAMAVGAAVGAAIGAGVELYRQRNQEHTDWGQVGAAALVGGCLGAIGAGVGAVAEAAAVGAVGVLAAGALAGGLAAGVEYCVQAAGTGEWDWKEFGETVAVGAAIGAVTAGVGGFLARRARRAAQAAREADEAAQRAAREAAAARRAARREVLATDPGHQGKPPSPKTLREADVGLALEDQGKLKAPISRDPNPAGAEFIDGDGVKWDVKRFNSNFPAKKGGFDLGRDMGKVESELAKGENVIVDTVDMSPADAAALKKAVNDKGLADRVIFYP